MLNVKKHYLCSSEHQAEVHTTRIMSLQHEDEEEKKVFTRVLKYSKTYFCTFEQTCYTYIQRKETHEESYFHTYFYN